MERLRARLNSKVLKEAPLDFANEVCTEGSCVSAKAPAREVGPWHLAMAILDVFCPEDVR